MYLFLNQIVRTFFVANLPIESRSLSTEINSFSKLDPESRPLDNPLTDIAKKAAKSNTLPKILKRIFDP